MRRRSPFAGRFVFARSTLFAIVVRLMYAVVVAGVCVDCTDLT